MKFALFLTLFITGTIGASAFASKSSGFSGKLNLISTSQKQILSERGLEIRYYVFDKKTSAPSEIIVENVKYSLYKSKEEAVKAVTNANVKRDYVIVYVVSDKKKDPEVVTIKE